MDILAGGVGVSLVLGGVWVGNQQSEIATLRRDVQLLLVRVRTHEDKDAHEQAGRWITELRSFQSAIRSKQSEILRSVERIDERLRRGSSYIETKPSPLLRKGNHGGE